MSEHAAGWHRVPNSNTERFFNGVQWTESYRPLTPAATQITTQRGIFPGWYADPWNPHALRWWDGTNWRHNTAPVPKRVVPPQRRPWRRFLAPFIIIAVGSPVIGLIVLAVFATTPVVAPLVAVPTAILAAALWWMDRLEPEPLDGIVVAFGWGAVVAPLFALITGLPIAAVFGDVAATVAGAPITEELAKGAVLLFLLHRRVIDSMIDGAMYAVAAAAGFAITEDIFYFAEAAVVSGEQLLVTFVGRGVLMPFAHPLFTIWMGIAAGWVVLRRPSTPVAFGVAAGSLGIAIGLHALWNGTLVAAAATENLALLIVVAVFFIALFASTVVAVVLLRRHQTRDFEQQVPDLAALTRLTAAETAVFADTKAYLRQRRQLPPRKRRLLGQLRWNLHALGSLRRVPPRTAAEATSDAAELEYLRESVTSLRQKLMT